MYSDVPNLAQCFGYMQAGSYTLRVDLTCRYICRMLNYMDRKGFRKILPYNDDPDIEIMNGLEGSPLTSGYLVRALAMMPKQSVTKPWRRYENYLIDYLDLKFGRLKNKGLRFSA